MVDLRLPAPGASADSGSPLPTLLGAQTEARVPQPLPGHVLCPSPKDHARSPEALLSIPGPTVQALMPCQEPPGVRRRSFRNRYLFGFFFFYLRGMGRVTPGGTWN